MQNLIFRGPVNSLSFGNVTYNLLREMYRKQMNVAIFPIGDNLSFEAYDKIDEELKSWIVSSVQNRFHIAKKEWPTLAQWHLNGSELRVSPRQYLYTFYEVDQPTLIEKAIVDLQDKTIFSSKHAESKFKSVGCHNTCSVPVGFDEDFEKTDKTYLPNKIHFGLMGKFEKRKHTKEIIQTWIKKYGNNNKYLLSCCVVNPFLKHEQMNALLSDLLDGKHYTNVNFLPHLKTNSEVNHLLNSADIDLTGLSGAEGWNLPSFNATALGKWSIVYNHSAHKAWATEKNSILLEPKGQEPAADGLFFSDAGFFNIGDIHSFDPDQVTTAMEEAEKKVGQTNSEGIKLQEDFSYEKTLNIILEKMELKNG